MPYVHVLLVKVTGFKRFIRKLVRTTYAYSISNQLCGQKPLYRVSVMIWNAVICQCWLIWAEIRVTGKPAFCSSVHIPSCFFVLMSRRRPCFGGNLFSQRAFCL